MKISQAIALAKEHYDAGRPELAVEICGRILAVEPASIDALQLVGTIAQRFGRATMAAEYFRRVIAADPQNAEAHNSLGVILNSLGRLDEAVACWRRAVELDARDARLLNNLGAALNCQGKLEEAVACQRRALELKPDYAEALNNLGVSLNHLGRLDEAAACCRRALELRPEFAGACCNLGNTLKNQGELDEAIACWRRALELSPSSAETHSNLLCALLYHPDYDARTIFEEHRRWNEQHAVPLAGSMRPHHNDRSPERRLRIGYVSPDFYGHPVGRFILPVLESHDHTGFEIFCYASVTMPDGVTDRCRTAADVWRNTPGQSDEEFAELVREDRIDVLVDLTMHTAGSRLLAFARRPAPVQVCYLAYCGTTGLDAMDYRLTDPYLDPPDAERRLSSEEPWRLPETYWCYWPVVSMPSPGELPALGAGHVTFGCLNNFCKLNEPLLEVWARLLRAMPTSRMLLHVPAGRARDRVRALLGERGVQAERLTLVERVAFLDYMAAYRGIDVGLDPFPHGGGTTTCEALWMGVPVVSLAGQVPSGAGA